MLIINNLEDLLKAIQEKKHYPEGLGFHLVDDNDDSEPDVKSVKRAEIIVTALQSGLCFSGLRLDLAGNDIRAKGAKVLASALESGHCPYGLRLELPYNNLGDEGAKVLADALQSGHCPPGLQLLLQYNSIRDEGAKAIASALRSGNCPPELQLSLSRNRFSKENARDLEEAWKVYHIKQQEKFLKCVALQHGHQQAGSPLSQLPQEILEEIYCYILPATPVSAKMAEIYAKVFRENYALGLFCKKSTAASALDKDLETALSVKSFAKKAEMIKRATEHFLQEELGALKKGEFIHSPTVALLCKYHLITSNKAIEDPNHRDYFQLSVQQTTELKIK